MRFAGVLLTEASEFRTTVVHMQCYVWTMKKEKKAKRWRKAERTRITHNMGRLHAAKCEWCKLKMACCCYFDDSRDKPTEPHPLVMCPQCQVTEFIATIFGAKNHEDARPTRNDG
jgi:hypothetical protein